MAGSDTRTATIVLQQAQVVAYAIPVVGAGIAAVMSAVEALETAFGTVDGKDWDQAKAIQDVATEVLDAIGDLSFAEDVKAVNGWTDIQVQIEPFIKKWTPSDGASQPLAQETALLTDKTPFGVFDDLKGTNPPTSDPSQDQVKHLAAYLTARTAYHGWHTSVLRYLATACGQDPDTDWTRVHSDVRTSYETSLQQADDYVSYVVDYLAKQSSTLITRCEAAAGAQPDARSHNSTFTTTYRKLRDDAHLDLVSADDIATYVKTRDLMRSSLANLKTLPPDPARNPRLGGTTTPTDPPAGNPTNPPAGNPTPAAPALGPRPAKSVRVLFEPAPKAGGYVPVLANSAVCRGTLVSQNAGALQAPIYYQVGGGTLNQAFRDALATAGVLSGVNTDLATAYDAKYGAGAFAADSAHPPSPPRLTSLLVAVDNSNPPIGSDVVGMVYSVGPVLSSAGITDPAGYTAIYADAFAAIDAWNTDTTKTPIAAFRVTLLSTGAYAGGAAGPALDATAAGLVLDAAVAAFAAHPSLANLTLVCDPSHAAAFTTAAAAHGVTATAAGFDLAHP